MVLTDSYQLRAISLTNNDSSAVRVALSTSPALANSVSFQLENPNLGLSDTDTNQLYNVIGLVSAA
jgi:hypothetical protein